MTLATHIVIAAALTKPIAAQHPILAALVAIASHYLSDAIPHWDYGVKSVLDNENLNTRRWSTNRALLRRDMRRFAIDGFSGAAIVLLVVWPTTTTQWLWIATAIIGGALPDFLQGVSLFLPFLRPHTRFHHFMHTKIKLGPYPLIGIPFQIVITLVAIWFLC